MKPFIIVLSFYFVAGSLLTCRHADPDPAPFLDGTPRLKSISLSGIPQGNIAIDQVAKVISVRMPATAPDYIDISMTLTDNAEWINRQSGARGSSLFGCDSCFHIYLKDKTDVASQARVDYRVRLIPSAPLTVDVLPSPLPFFIRNSNTVDVQLPMLNLYGNKLPIEARLTHATTGEVLRINRKSTSYPAQPTIYYSAATNKLSIYLYDVRMKPGSYQIDLLLDDGTVLPVSQPLLAAPGTPDVDYQSKLNTGYRVAVGKTLTLEGYNLFASDITLDLLDSQDQVHPLSGLVFDPYGRTVQVPIPANLPPGQYVMRMWQRDIKLPYGYCLRVNLLKDELERPFIGLIGTDPTPCSLRDPVSVQRGVQLAFFSSIQQQAINSVSQHASLKLVSLADKATYYGAVIGNDVNLGWSANSLTIPATVPPGLYTATLQVLDAQNNVVGESEPYGRVLDLK